MTGASHGRAAAYMRVCFYFPITFAVQAAFGLFGVHRFRQFALKRFGATRQVNFNDSQSVLFTVIIQDVAPRHQTFVSICGVSALPCLQASVLLALPSMR